MNWIRIATKMKSDPKLGRIAAACGVPMAHAVGLVTCVLTELPEHARTGDVAHVPDVILEQWALWTGPAGVFAAAFRAELCDATGVVTGWEKHNGAAIRDADRTRERAKQWRDERQRTVNERRTNAVPNGVRTPYEPRTITVANGVRTDLRDGTGRDERTTSSLRAEVVLRGALADEAPVTLPFTDPQHTHAATCYARAHQFPDAFRATLSALASGQGAPNGQPVPWETIGQALCEMQGAGARFTPNALRAFVRRLQEKPATPLTWDDLLTPVPDESGVTHVA